MIYATWIINFDDNPNDGSTPEPEIRLRGGQASGGLMVESQKVLGYIWDYETIDNEIANKWQIIILTQNEALTLAQTINPEIYLAADGTLQSPAIEI